MRVVDIVEEYDLNKDSLYLCIHNHKNSIFVKKIGNFNHLDMGYLIHRQKLMMKFTKELQDFVLNTSAEGKGKLVLKVRKLLKNSPNLDMNEAALMVYLVSSIFAIPINEMTPINTRWRNQTYTLVRAIRRLK